MRNIFVKNSFYIFCVLLFISCQENKNKAEDVKLNEIREKTSENFDLIGRKAVLIYPDFKAEVNYLSDSSLYWKSTTNEGKVAEGKEKIFLKNLNNNQYFINWIEQDGLTISQVVDIKDKKVVSFASFKDEASSQGKRGSIVLEGQFILLA